MAKLVANVYGDALFSLGEEKHSLDALYQDVLFVKQSLEANPEIMQTLRHPRISAEEKEALLCQVFAEPAVSADMLGLLTVVLKKSRQEFYPAIFDYFISRYKEYRGIGVVYVTTPVELTEEQKRSIEQRLLETTKYRQLEMQYGLDPSLIGGAVIRIQDRVVDSSIKTRLLHLSRDLKKIQLKR